jgi:hypothetical protein
MNNEITLNVRNFDSLLAQFIENVELGNFSAIECLGRFKEFENALVKAKKCIEEQAIEEAEKHTEKTFKLGDFKVTKVEGRRMIDFSDIEEWRIAKDNLKEIEDKYKQVALSSLTSLDQSTGEILQRPIITFSKSSISIRNV